MSHTRAQLLIHLVFSTKDRMQDIDDGIRETLHAYIAGIINKDGSKSVSIGSSSDHVHILFALSKNNSLSDTVRKIKIGSSKWIKTKGDDYSRFQWQSGYGAFSVSQSKVLDVTKYIKNQKSHHNKMTFKEELKKLFDKHCISYDERFLWD